MEEQILLNVNCTRMPYIREVMEKCIEFTCGDTDLDDFFRHDVFFYEEEMLSKCYCWVTNLAPHQLVAIVTLTNDSIKSSTLPKQSRNRFHRQFNNEKRNKTYPATLIGRLGVNVKLQGSHIGRQIMDYIKLTNLKAININACRFLVVEALNNPKTLAYYERNGFVFMHKTEEIERQSFKRYDQDGKLEYDLPEDQPLETRMMFFDLKKLSNP